VSRRKTEWFWDDCSIEIANEDLQAMADDDEFCPCDCEHKTEIYPDQVFLGFTALYLCQKYRCILGLHAARPMAAMLGGDPTVLVLKAPFCRRRLEAI